MELCKMINQNQRRQIKSQINKRKQRTRIVKRKQLQTQSGLVQLSTLNMKGLNIKITSHCLIGWIKTNAVMFNRNSFNV